MAKETKYQVRITGRLPFSSVSIPGQVPSIVVDRDGVTLTEDQLAALRKAVEEKAEFEPMTKDNLDVQKVESSAEPEEPEEEPEGEPTGKDPLEGVAFTSDSAKKSAQDAELTADDFEEGGGTGSEGAYTVADVEKIAAGPEEPEEETE